MAQNIALVVLALLFAYFIFSRAGPMLASNKGKILRNIVIWLVIFATLGFVYNHFVSPNRNGAEPLKTLSPNTPEMQPTSSLPQDQHDKEFTPPKE